MTHDPAVDRPRHALDRDAMLACAAALSDACRAALDATVDDPTAVRAAGRTLGLDKTIAWKLVRIAHATDPREVFALLPGPRGWTRIHEALIATEGGDPLADEVRRAVAALDAEATARGIPRSRIRSWSATDVRGPDGPRSNRVASERERVRETLTQANVAIWGVGATAILRSFILAPADEPGRCRAATVTTLHGLHRTRPGPEWPIHRIIRVRNEDATAEDRIDRPIDRPSPIDGTVIDCRDLCTPGGLDDTGTIETGTGTFRTFRGDRTGPSDRIDLVFPDLPDATAPMFATTPGESVELGLSIRIPCSLALIDVLRDRGLPWPDAPQRWSFSDIGGLPTPPALEPLHRMPMSEPIEGPTRVVSNDDLRPGADTVSDAVREAHATAVQRVLAALGIEATTLVRHRLRVAHPPLSTGIRIAWPLPEADPDADP